MARSSESIQKQGHVRIQLRSQWSVACFLPSSHGSGRRAAVPSQSIKVSIAEGIHTSLVAPAYQRRANKSLTPNSAALSTVITKPAIAPKYVQYTN